LLGRGISSPFRMCSWIMARSASAAISKASSSLSPRVMPQSKCGSEPAACAYASFSRVMTLVGMCRNDVPMPHRHLAPAVPQVRPRPRVAGNVRFGSSH
jgi:hypothetical protein